MSVKLPKARERLTQALTSLLLEEPFFGSLAMRLELIEDETVQTEATNGRYIKYNPTFIESLSFEQIKAEICHEVLHCAKLHPWRRDARDSKLWNVATDYVINGELKSAGYKLGASWLLDAQYTGMSEEQVYNKLDSQSKPQQDQQGEQSGKHGEVQDGAPGLDGEGAEEQQQNWQQAVLQAAQQAKQQGKLPGFAQTMVDSIARPKIDWRVALRKFIEQTAKNDFTWAQPNRNYLNFGLYLPSLRSDKLPPIVFYWDTSGSRWSSEQIKLAASELSAIIQEARPEKTVIIYGDSKVCNVQEFELSDAIKFNPKGGGGTDFACIFDYVETHEIEPCCFIGLTDLCGSFPPVAPPYPVMWVCDEKRATAPFGEVVEI